MGDERILRDAAGDLSKTDHSWSHDKFRITPANGEKEIDIIDGEEIIIAVNSLPKRMGDISKMQQQITD